MKNTLILTLLTTLLGATAHAVTVYAFDINESNAPTVTGSGFTPFVVDRNTGAGSTVQNGITFSIAGAAGARNRSVGSSDLTRDFAFVDGSGAFIDFNFGAAGALAAGQWDVEIWVGDTQEDIGIQSVGLITNGTKTTQVASVTPSVSATPPAASFSFVSDGSSSYGIFVTENSARDRTRLNGIRLTQIPEPSLPLLSLLGILPFLRRRRTS